MKSILISIRPQWCEKIANGEKAIEVRKSAPKEVPFKAYIYETKGATETPWVDEDGHFIYKGRGQVIGEFICDEVEKFSVGSLRCDDIEKLACLSYREMINYFYKPEELDGKTSKMGYAWHISDLKIYDKPKELSEFKRYCNQNNSCENCPYYDYVKMQCVARKITRPPQSWQYVEEVEQ